LITLGATLLASALFCWLYLLVARRLQLLDRPNERSAHSLPTPHGGGGPGSGPVSPTTPKLIAIRMRSSKSSRLSVVGMASTE